MQKGNAAKLPFGAPLRALPLSTSPSPNSSPNLNAARHPTALALNAALNNVSSSATNLTGGAKTLNLYGAPPPPADKTDRDNWSNALAVARQKRIQELAESFPERTLYCLSKTNLFRRLCISLVEWK